MGLNINEMFPSKWLKAEDFEPGEDKVLTIKDVKYETLGQGAKAEDKPVIEFREVKPLVLNKTNAHVIGQLYGGQTDNWIGKRITAYTMEVDSFGDIVRAIRIRNAIPGEAAQAAAQSGSTPHTAPQTATQTTMPTPPQTGEQMISGEQKTAILREAIRVWGEADYKNTTKTKIGNVGSMTAKNANDWIDWFATEQDFQVPDFEDDDSDPFAD